jgi:hypothetical protein
VSEGPTYYDHLYLSYGDLLRPGVRLGLGWNRGAPPPLLRGLLTDRLATTDHLFDPACSGGTRSDARLAATATPRVRAATPRVRAATPRVRAATPRVRAATPRAQAATPLA